MVSEVLPAVVWRELDATIGEMDEAALRRSADVEGPIGFGVQQIHLSVLIHRQRTCHLLSE